MFTQRSFGGGNFRHESFHSLVLVRGQQTPPRWHLTTTLPPHRKRSVLKTPPTKEVPQSVPPPHPCRPPPPPAPPDFLLHLHLSPSSASLCLSLCHQSFFTFSSSFLSARRLPPIFLLCCILPPSLPSSSSSASLSIPPTESHPSSLAETHVLF